jgi:hypothetical protein
MAKGSKRLQSTTADAASWVALLEEMRREYWASEELTEQEKRFLDELEDLPESEWQPIDCSGKPFSEAVIEERRTR